MQTLSVFLFSPTEKGNERAVLLPLPLFSRKQRGYHSLRKFIAYKARTYLAKSNSLSGKSCGFFPHLWLHFPSFTYFLLHLEPYLASETFVSRNKQQQLPLNCCRRSYIISSVAEKRTTMKSIGCYSEETRLIRGHQWYLNLMSQEAFVYDSKRRGGWCCKEYRRTLFSIRTT